MWFIELATRIPERIISLFLAVTTPGDGLLTNLPPVCPYSLILLGSFSVLKCYSDNLDLTFYCSGRALRLLLGMYLVERHIEPYPPSHSCSIPNLEMNKSLTNSPFYCNTDFFSSAMLSRRFPSFLIWYTHNPGSPSLPPRIPPPLPQTIPLLPRTCPRQPPQRQITRFKSPFTAIASCTPVPKLHSALSLKCLPE